MRHRLTFFLLLSASLIHGQQCDWLTSAPVAYENNPSMANVVLASAPDKLIAARQVSGVFVYGSDLYGEAALEQLDPETGSAIWSCLLSDSVNVESAVVSAEGKAYFAGRFMGDMALCDGTVLGEVPGQTVWNVNLFLVAVDLNTGIIEWSRNLAFTHEEALGIPSLAIDPQGHLWYAVAEWGVGKAVRVDANGDDAETRIVDGVRNLGTISFDPWGGLYMSGALDDAGFAFGGQSYQGYGTTGYNMFVLRYKPDGTAGFAAFAEDITFQGPTVVATTDGHAYLAGNLFDPTQWGDLPFGGPNWGGGMFLAKVDSTGNFLWGAESATMVDGQITGDLTRSKGPCIAVDAASNVYLMADARGTIGWGNGIASGTGAIADRVQSIVAFNAMGNAQWAVNSVATAGFNEARTLTASAIPDAIHFAGHARDTFTFGPHTTNLQDQQAAVFGKLSGLSTTVREQPIASDLRVWPVPAEGVVNVECASNVPTTAVLLNSAGQLVRTIPLMPGRSSIGVGDLQSGLYLLRTGQGAAVRLVKE